MSDPHAPLPPPKPLTEDEKAARRADLAWLHAIPAPRKPRANRRPPAAPAPRANGVDPATGLDDAIEE